MEDIIIKIYITDNKNISCKFTDDMKTTISFNKYPNNNERFDMTFDSHYLLIKKLCKEYNTNTENMTIHYSNYSTDRNSKVNYPRYVIIIDEELYNVFTIKERDKTINNILK